MNRSKQSNGIVLLIVLAILGLMSVLALAFVQIARLERGISRNYVDHTRALLAAESGIEHARSRLLEFNASVLSTQQFNDMEYTVDAAFPTVLQSDIKPSFQTEIQNVTGSGILQDNDNIKTYFTLRVEDESTKLNLNDSNDLWNQDNDPYADTNTFSDPDYDPSVTRLSALVEILVDLIYKADPSPPLSELVSIALFDLDPSNIHSRPNLPGGKFNSLQQVHDALVQKNASGNPIGALTEDQFTVFLQYVTLWSWQDQQVLKPNFKLQISTPDASGVAGYPLPNPNAIPTDYVDINNPDDAKLIRNQKWTFEPIRNWTRDLYLWSDWQTTEFELEPRCPINVNGASEEILHTLIAPLQGWYLREGPGNTLSVEPHSHRMARQVSYQYFWEDSRDPEMTGRVMTGAPTIDKTFLDSSQSRFGQAFQTPLLQDVIVASDSNAPLPRSKALPFPEAAAQFLYAHIHDGLDWNGNGSIDADNEMPNPIETWEEFEYILERMLQDFFPDNPASSDLSMFWSASDSLWIPQPEFYDTADFVINMVGGMFPMAVNDRWGAYYGLISAEPMTPWIDLVYWNAHCRTLLKDLLLANFNPNSQLNDYNPDRHIWRRIDKAQLTQYSTELVFQSIGPYHIRSVGVVLNPDNPSGSSAEIDAVIDLVRPFRITTQAQFMKDFAEPKQYAKASSLLETAWDTTVISYPEPLLHDNQTGDGAYFDKSIYDGYLMPATWEIDYRGTSGAVMWAPFDGRVNSHSDLQANNIMRVVGSQAVPWEWTRPPTSSWMGLVASNGFRWRLHNQPTSSRLTYTKGTITEPVAGCLLPDGSLSDPGRGIAFENFNIGGIDTGATQFWVKPNFDCENTSRARCIFDFSANRAEIKDTAPSWNWAANGTGYGSNYSPRFQLMFTPHYLYNKDEVVGMPFLTVGASRQASVNCLRLDLLNVVGGFRRQSITSPTVTANYPNQTSGKSNAHTAFQFESHQWSHIVLGWDIDPLKDIDDPSDPSKTLLGARATDPSKLYLQINGNDAIDNLPNQAVDQLRKVNTPLRYMHRNYNQVFDDMEWIRFGGGGSETSRNQVGDCTYDDIMTYTAFRPSGTPIMPTADTEIYSAFGRYYKPDLPPPGELADIPVYTSPNWDLFSEMKWHENSIHVIGVAWTGYWPKYNLQVDRGNVTNKAVRPLQANDDDRPDPLVDIYQPLTHWTSAYGPRNGTTQPNGWGWLDSAGKKESLDPFSVDVCRVDQSGMQHWATDFTGTATSEPRDNFDFTFAYPGGSKVWDKKNNTTFTIQPGERFRFRIYFNTDPGDGLGPGDLLYEAPVIDDITFFISSDSILSWKIVQ